MPKVYNIVISPPKSHNTLHNNNHPKQTNNNKNNMKIQLEIFLSSMF